MNIEFRNRKIQFLWCGEFPALKYWNYGKSCKQIYGKPLLHALYFGLFEIRYFPPLVLKEVR